MPAKPSPEGIRRPKKGFGKRLGPVHDAKVFEVSARRLMALF